MIPGLVGLHNHTFYTTRGRSVQLQFSAPRLYLGSGLTTIRTTGGTSPYHEINMKRGIDRGQIPGPRMHLTGPYLTGPGGASTMAQIGVAGGGATHRQLLGGRRRDVVQGLHRHQPRDARRGHQGGACARPQVHRPSVLGVVPRGGQARHRQPRARAVHQQRLRPESHAGSVSVRHARQPAEGGDRRPRGAADDPRDGHQQGGDVVDAGRVRAVVSRIARRSKIGCSRRWLPRRARSI